MGKLNYQFITLLLIIVSTALIPTAFPIHTFAQDAAQASLSNDTIGKGKQQTIIQNSIQNPIQNPLQTLYFGSTRALFYAPENLDPTRRYPLIIGLHGLGQELEYTAEHYVEFVKKNQYFLLCPQGGGEELDYERWPQDDRVRFKQLTEQLILQYPIDRSQVVVSGFSRGGNIAIEMGILYPETFPKILSMFSFFNDTINGQDLVEIASIKSVQGYYDRFHIWFVTGKEDLSEENMKQTYRFFHEILIDPYMITFPNLIHAYPPNLDRILTLLLNKKT